MRDNEFALRADKEKKREVCSFKIFFLTMEKECLINTQHTMLLHLNVHETHHTHKHSHTFNLQIIKMNTNQTTVNRDSGD